MLEKFSQQSQKILDSLKEELKRIRTGRANPELVSHLLVEAYGQMLPISQLASISLPDFKTIILEPWDKNLIKEIEKAISQSDLGLGITVKDNKLYLSLPPLTEENRKKMVKILKEKLEQFRKEIRSIRDDFRSEIITQERNKEITEDDKYRLLEELDKKTNQLIKEIDQMGEKKEKEIMTV